MNKYMSTNMQGLLKDLCTTFSVAGIRIEQTHILTAAALIARGAAQLSVTKNRPGIYLRVTPEGKNLYNWADKAKFESYFKVRPKVHDAKTDSKKAKE